MKAIKVIFIQDSDRNLTSESIIKKYNGSKVYNFICSDSFFTGMMINHPDYTNTAFVISDKFVTTEIVDKKYRGYPNLQYLSIDNNGKIQKQLYSAYYIFTFCPKKLIKPGMVVEFRNGTRCLVINVKYYFNKISTLFMHFNGFMTLDSYNDNLEIIGRQPSEECFTIDAIYDPGNAYGLGFGVVNYKNLTPIWKRKSIH